MEYSNEDFRNLFQNKFSLDSWTNLLGNFFYTNSVSKELRKEPEQLENSYDGEIAYYLGFMDTSDSYHIGFFYFKLENENVMRKRVGLRSLVRKFINPKWGEFDAAIVVFDDNNHWRLSFITDIKGEATAPKRYTYVFGDYNLYNTPVSRFLQLQKDGISYANIKAAFSVEALSNEFYKDLQKWYDWAMSENVNVTFPNKPEEISDDREKLNIKLIRLITRLLFVWFIKQKELVPKEIFNENYIKTILKNFEPESTTEGNYYNAILQNLFFATLNCAIIDEDKMPRRFAEAMNARDTRNLYRYKEMFSISENDVIEMFAKVPFLNGGLFECLDKPKGLYKNLDYDILYDGFSRNATKASNGNFKYRAFVPNILFFNSNEAQPGLINLLKRYNFTIEENKPNDAVVSLDPELLGSVFENLLAYYNPETQNTAKKATGSFYTPRIIVNYMVDESLKNYILDKNIVGVNSTNINKLFDEDSDYLQFDKKTSDKIIAALKGIKILDPACGSGAFPMGCLLKIVEIIEKLSHCNVNKYALKLEIIENCVYGVDIQSIAMLICKLRFFISLICDQENINLNDPEHNFGINTLPNLETKFVAADSLLNALVKSYDNDWTKDEKLSDMQKELLDVRKRHFDAKGRKAKRKGERDDEDLREKIQKYIVSLKKVDSNKIKWIDKQLSKDNLKGKERKELEQMKDKELEINGFSAAVKQLTEWNPYDQNSVSEFFDAEWMFGVKAFDIVIGNPPYIQLQNGLASRYENQGYETFARTGDIYCLFYERANKLLKDGGINCFITSNKWMRAGYGEALRKFLSEQNPVQLLDFGGVKVFESATVDTNILLIQKGKNQEQTLCAVANKNVGIQNMSDFMQRNAVKCVFSKTSGKAFEKASGKTSGEGSGKASGGEAWVILSPIEQSIKRKIELAGTPLKDWDIQINYGIKTGCNEAFIITTEKRNEILENCKTPEEKKSTAEIIRPILRGRDIKRYSYEWKNLWVILAYYGSHKIIPSQYPAIYNHLLKYEDVLKKRGQCRYTSSGKTKIDAEFPGQHHWLELDNNPTLKKLEDFNKQVIAWQRITAKNQFCLTKSGMVVLDSMAFLSNLGKYSKLLLAILNSSLMYFWVKKNVHEYGDTGFRLSNQYVEQMPIIRLANTEKIDNIVDKLLDTSKFGYPIYKNDASNIDTKTITKLQKQMDAFVYSIYGLTEEEIRFVEQ